MFDHDQFHDPEFTNLVQAARAVIAERTRRGVATPAERLAVAALDEMPDEDDDAAVRALGTLGRLPGRGAILGPRDAGALRRHRRGSHRRGRPRRRRRDDALTPHPLRGRWRARGRLQANDACKVAGR